MRYTGMLLGTLSNQQTTFPVVGSYLRLKHWYWQV